MQTEVVLAGLLIPFLGTIIGASFVFFMRREMPVLMQKALLGFASGVMVAASVWSLLLPSLSFVPDAAGWAQILPTAGGFLAGMGFLLLVDYLTPHLHIGDETPEGLPVRRKLSRTTMLSLSVAIHNLPEGMAVGVVLANALQEGLLGSVGSSSSVGLAGSASSAGVIAMAVGIAIQNIPEGAIISMPMRAEGHSRLKSFLIGSLSGAVEPVGCGVVLLLTAFLTPFMPALLAFAAGAMMYVVVEELIPESASGEHSNISTIGFALGFVLMMTLDVMLG